MGSLVSSDRPARRHRLENGDECEYEDAAPPEMLPRRWSAKAHPLVRKYCADRAGDPRHGRHEGSTGRIIQFAHVSDVTTRNDQRVAGMKLSKINECKGQVVLIYDARRNLARGDVAEDAAIVACPHWSNETQDQRPRARENVTRIQ